MLSWDTLIRSYLLVSTFFHGRRHSMCWREVGMGENVSSSCPFSTLLQVQIRPWRTVMMSWIRWLLPLPAIKLEIMFIVNVYTHCHMNHGGKKMPPCGYACFVFHIFLGRSTAFYMLMKEVHVNNANVSRHHAKNKCTWLSLLGNSGCCYTVHVMHLSTWHVGFVCWGVGDTDGVWMCI